MKILKYIQLKSDQCIFVRWNKDGEFVWIIIYVDDMLLFALRESFILNAMKELMTGFKMKDLGRVTVFLGVRFHFLMEGLFIEQQEYSKQLLATFSMDKCNHTSTPMSHNKNKRNRNSTDKENPSLNQIIGKLLVVCHTYPHGPVQMSHMLSGLCQENRRHHLSPIGLMLKE